MRCNHCRSYIPDGLTNQSICPTCGAHFDEKAQTIPVADSFADEKTPIMETVKPRTGEAFAPYFTIKTRLAFGVADITLAPTMGSVSFGPDGFSIVWDHGTKWEKIFYKDLDVPTMIDDSVKFDLRGHESKVTFYHPWLPDFLKGPRRKRAAAFIELLSNVQRGLSTIEISKYQQTFK